MAELTIRTNHHWRTFINGIQLTDKERKEFDYMKELNLDLGTFFRYRGEVYSLDEFSYIGNMHPDMKGYDYYLSETFFSGVMIKLNPEDDEQYQVATYYS